MFYLVDSKAISLINTNAEILRNQPVEVIYNSSAYVVEGVPETVSMTLIGNKMELYLARQLGDNEVVVDLSDYQASEKSVEVRLSYNKPIKNLDYQISPEFLIALAASSASNVLSNVSFSFSAILLYPASKDIV